MVLTSKRVIESTVTKCLTDGLGIGNGEENGSSGPLDVLIGASQSLKKDINKSDAFMQSVKLSPRLREFSLADGAMITQPHVEIISSKEHLIQ